MSQTKFATPFAMKCTYDQFESVKDRLIEMGYKIETPYKQSDFDSGKKVLATNVQGENNRLYPLHFGVGFQYGRIEIEEWNEELCLALAAMTEGESSSDDEFYNFLNINEGTTTTIGPLKKHYGIGLGYRILRKATAQELIGFFKIMTSEILTQDQENTLKCMYNNGMIKNRISFFDFLKARIDIVKEKRKNRRKLK